MAKSYVKRSPEQMISDLEAEIERVKARAIAKEAKAQPEGKALIVAVRALDKAARVAADAGNKEVMSALEGARAALAPAIVGLGLRIPEKAKRGRRKKGEAA